MRAHRLFPIVIFPLLIYVLCLSTLYQKYTDLAARNLFHGGGVTTLFECDSNNTCIMTEPEEAYSVFRGKWSGLNAICSLRRLHRSSWVGVWLMADTNVTGCTDNYAQILESSDYYKIFRLILALGIPALIGLLVLGIILIKRRHKRKVTTPCNFVTIIFLLSFLHAPIYLALIIWYTIFYQENTNPPGHIRLADNMNIIIVFIATLINNVLYVLFL